MKGRVDAYDPVNGFGFIKVDEATYFAHNSDIRLTIPVSAVADLRISPPQFLLPGWDVEFEPVQQQDGRWKAMEIRPLKPEGFTVTVPRWRPEISADGVITVEVAADNELKILGRPVEPMVKAEAFGLFYIGNGVVKSFNVRVPESNSNRALVVVTPSPEKGVSRPTPDGLYNNVRRGSFVLTVYADGSVVVRKIGTHNYEGTGWLALSLRFECKLDFSKPGLTVEQVVAQMPSVGKEDANWGFAPGILRGIELMKTAVAAK